MKQERHYFMINKRSDYEKSAWDNMEYDENGIFVSQGSGQNRGVFLSRVLDSRIPENDWHRLVLKVNDDSAAPYRISVYASEEPDFIWKGVRVRIRDFIANSSVPMSDKLKNLNVFLKKTVTGHADLLLHDVKGRYLWIGLEVYRQFGQELKIERITTYFPKQSWLSYLPEFYEASDTEHFLDRYLSVFQSIYDDLNEEIGNIPYLLDVATTNSEYLDFMCHWIGVTKSQVWQEEKKRILLSEAAGLFKIRGTRKGLLKLLHLYLEDEVYLVEKHQWKRAELTDERERLYESLYGTSSYIITVLVKEASVPGRKEYQTLTQVINSMKPAQAELKLVVLKPYLYLGGYSYLGLNSVLGEYSRASLDGRSVLSLTTIGGKQKERLEHEEY